MQVVLFNDLVYIFENDLVKRKMYFISNGLAKQVNKQLFKCA